MNDNDVEFWTIETVQKDGGKFSEQYVGRKAEAIERIKFNLRLIFVDYCLLFKETEVQIHGEKRKGYEQVGRYMYSDFAIKPPEWLCEGLCLPKGTDNAND